MKNQVERSVITLVLLIALVGQSFAQTATKTSISGLVTDAQGTALAGANVRLRDQATNIERSATTYEEGRYVFGNLDPGTYELTVTFEQFRTTTIRDIRAEIAKPVTQDVRLDVGGVSEAVTVNAGSEAQLHKQDAAVGNTFDEKCVATLPNPTRDATRLLLLQPGATPSGEISGARADQSTFSLDGLDISDNAFGTTFTTIIPTPVEAIEEFRVTVANPNTTFARSSGGQFTLVTKRGTNEFHGSVYAYHQNDNLNANSWTNNRLGLERPFLIDNRFGASLGGPIFRDQTFFFLFYEGRRNSSNSTVTRLVPTPSLRQGLLRFPDATGTPRTIDPRDFDPRGIGPSPAILAYLNLYPLPNDMTVGDGLNTAGYVVNIGTPIEDDLGIVRLDHRFNSRWSFDGSMKAFRRLTNGTQQVSILDHRSEALNPNRPRSLSLGLTGLLSSNLNNEFRFGWVHDRPLSDRRPPVPLVEGLNIAVNLAGGVLDEPVDVGQAASRQQRVLNIYQFIDNLIWSKNAHTIQAGFNIRHLRAYDFRGNKPGAAINVPVAELTAGSFNQIPASQRPSFIQAADASRYNQLYSALLGLVDNIAVLATRDGNLQPNPVGTAIISNSRMNTFEFYFAGTWNVRPSLTLSYGLTYQWDEPPVERDGRQMIAVLRDSGEILNPKEYLRQKFEAAARGEVYNPDLAWLPVNETNLKLFEVDRHNFAPRVSVAWNPSFGEGVLGTLFGDKQTVMRGGYALMYDRVNIPTLEPIPTLSIGFANTVSLPAPSNSAGEPFRAGVDGPMPVPVATAAVSPIVPSKPFGELLGILLDPFLRTPYSHMFDFTVQRSLPGNMIVELGYVGRLGRSLFQGVNLNQVPYNFLDTRSNQTFAQAYDALAAQLRAGVAPSAVTAQPWFENLLIGLAPVDGSRTRALAAAQTANIVNGNLSSLFTFMDARAAEPFNNRQVSDFIIRTSLGRSNYNAFFATVRKRFSNGFTFDANYTYSRSLDQIGDAQNQSSAVPNSFLLDSEYGPSDFDLRHLFNANWIDELPFGRGRSEGALKKLISGWHTSGILRASSGLPINIIQGTQVWGGGAIASVVTGAIPTASFETGLFHGENGQFNLFADPEAALAAVRPIRLSEDTRSGRNVVRGPGFWQVDLTIGKTTAITERVRLRFTADFLNAFNHVNFANPTLNLQTPATFGIITAQRINDTQSIFPRRIQLGGRIEF